MTILKEAQMQTDKIEQSLLQCRYSQVRALFVLGLATAAIGALDFVEWYTRNGEEYLQAAARRGPGGTTAALLCLLVVAALLLRKTWFLLVLPVVAHASLFVWQAGESMTFIGSLSGHGLVIAKSLTQWHLRVDVVTIVLGIGISVAAWILGTRPATEPPVEG